MHIDMHIYYIISIHKYIICMNAFVIEHVTLFLGFFMMGSFFRPRTNAKASCADGPDVGMPSGLQGGDLSSLNILKWCTCAG